ncbi:hypothetical protein [Acetobacter nitrogenifigens]|uniref:hypothetical protein n=1 Tax=Acetobacter nitrogenifigens TaxID=285268 RepID=UPI00047CBC7F|nr:hypothetical protein [Acetobacter nitrogenifigens]
MRHSLRSAFTTLLLSVAASTLGAGYAGAASGPTADSVYDLSGLPTFSGVVSQYLPSPNGQLSGFLLSDGTEIFLSRQLAETLPKLVKPGERVSGSGLKGKSLPIFRAVAVSGPHGQGSDDTAITMPQHGPEMLAGPDLVVSGVVGQQLYNVRGLLVGAILKDHTVVSLSPGGAAKVASWLSPGSKIYAVGPGATGDLGKALSAREIGPSADHLVTVVADDAPEAGNPPGSPGYDVIPASESH